MVVRGAGLGVAEHAMPDFFDTGKKKPRWGWTRRPRVAEMQSGWGVGVGLRQW
jgi:hypothetical protein